MQTILRPYQVKFIEEIRHSIGKHKRIIGCAATGSGKSKTFIAIAKSALSAGRTVLIISESVKIYNQIADEIQCININAGARPAKPISNQCYLAMAQTLTRRKYLIDAFAGMGNSLVTIVDECHISTPTKILKALPDSYLLGFSATPDYRTSRHLPELYKGIVIGPQPDELVNAGYLSPYRHFARIAANLDDLQTKGGEFTEESQEIVFEASNVLHELKQDLKSVPYKKCLIFTASIKHCEDLFEQLKSTNLKVVKVHSKLSKAEETFNMAQFMHGDAAICINVGILTKGFDFPAIDLVILLRATTSLPLFLQMIGRASRIYPGKTHFSVIDYGANYKRHGLWDEDRDWATMWNTANKKKKDGVAPIKNCPKCLFIVPAQAMQCPNCGYAFEKLPEEKKKRESVLIEINERYRSLAGRYILSLTPSELSIYANAKNKKKFAIRVAIHNDKKSPGYLDSFAKIMGYKSGWVWHQQQRTKGYNLQINDFILK